MKILCGRGTMYEKRTTATITRRALNISKQIAVKYGRNK